jgi:hypothetical protein
VSEKSSEINLGYAVKSRLARQRTDFRSPMWFGLENSLPSSTMRA